MEGNDRRDDERYDRVQPVVASRDQDDGTAQSNTDCRRCVGDRIEHYRLHAEVASDVPKMKAQAIIAMAAVTPTMTTGPPWTEGAPAVSR